MATLLAIASHVAASEIPVNTFAFRMYDAYKTEKGNLLVSPYSLAAAVAMLNAGAAGATKAAVTKALGFAPGADTSKAFHDLGLALAEGSDKDDVFEQANAIWPRKGLPLAPGFLSEIRNQFGGGVEALDFRAEPGDAAKRINSWTAENTKGKIAEIVGADDLVEAVLVLTNAVYFHGTWAKEFPKERTAPADFESRKGTRKVATMAVGLQAPYAETAASQLVALPYKGPFELVVVLPRKKTAPLTTLDLRRELRALQSAPWKEVVLRLPRFKMSLSYGLASKFPKLGLGGLLQKPDLSAMGAGGEVFVSKAVQKTFIEVNEKGTEAAAVTGMVEAGAAMPQPPVVFRADHPFAFAIRHRPTGAIIFLGRVDDPES